MRLQGVRDDYTSAENAEHGGIPMTDCEILKNINNGAVFYLNVFGNAEHMQIEDHGNFRYIYPKGDGQGVRLVYDIRLENLSVENAQAKIAEIKAMNVPVWWPVHISNTLYRLIHNKNREPVSLTPPDGIELYMAATSPTQIPAIQPIDGVKIQKSDDENSFALWARSVKDCFHDDFQYFHPQYHYPACKSGEMRCYLCRKNDRPVAVCSIMDNEGICSLENVATHMDYRRQGIAKYLCAVAMKEAFVCGAKLISLRAVEPGTRELYTSLGYRTYNHAV